MTTNGLFLQLEINNRIFFSAVIDEDSKESFTKVWEAAGPKIYERLLNYRQKDSLGIAHGAIRISPVLSD